jgi:cobaltochelatase CobS
VVLYRRTGAVHPLVPKARPGYVFRPEMVREFAWAVWPSDLGAPTPMLFTGPKGSGKTSFVEQMAAICNTPVHRVNLNVATSVRHLKGRQVAREGSTGFLPGVIPTAMEEGAWLLLDELSGATPPVALSLFPVFEPTGAVLLEDAEPQRYAFRHPEFRLFCTDNTIGAEQEETRFDYSGTNPDVNEALLDRIGSTIHVGYLKPEEEDAAVRGIVPHADELVIQLAIRVARKIREGGIGTGFSTRMVVEWVRRMAAPKRVIVNGELDTVPVDFPAPNEIIEAARYAFLNRARSKQDRDAIIEVISRFVGGES